MPYRRLIALMIGAAALLGVAASVLAQGYTVSPNAAIPDGGIFDCDPPTPGSPRVSEIVVSDTTVITDLNVLLRITHPWPGDLVVTLTHVETGTVVTLLDRPGKPRADPCGFDAENINAILDDAAPAAAHTTEPLTGTLRPNQALAAFNGQSIQGTWRLQVWDYVEQDTGTLNSWGLQANLDSDGDGVSDSSDNCPAVSNPGQANTDGDGQGDACDPDDDNDGVPDGSDNCPLVINPGQEDLDGDGIGYACETDTDSDGVSDDIDNCPAVFNPYQQNADGDGQGDTCDPDDDNDGVPDGSDNCVLVSNPGQEDNDGNGTGDACDGDLDGDGIDNATDNCPAVSNPGQEDADGDGIGDVCENDFDADGVADDTDNCPAVSNPGQEDSNGDGIGDACTVSPPPEPRWIGWNPGDGRLNPDPGAPLALYCDADSIYAYIPNYLEFDFPLDQINALPPAVQAAPVTRTLLATYPDGTRFYLLSTGEYQMSRLIDGEEVALTGGTSTSGGGPTPLAEGVSGARLYRLATGELQVNYAHGNEEYVFIFDGCPSTYHRTYVYDITTGGLLSDYTDPR